MPRRVGPPQALATRRPLIQTFRDGGVRGLLASVSRSGVFRSFVRAGADGVRARLRGTTPVALARRMLRELQAQRVVLTETQLTAAVVRTPGVEAASVTARRGALQVDVTYDGGEALAFALTPDGARFAPRGAKEVLFRVTPGALSTQSKVRNTVGSLAGAMANALWAVVLGAATPQRLVGAIVDRDGSEGVRVDLRSVPAVRARLGRGPAAMVLDLLELERVLIEDGQLVLKLKLPSFAG